MMMNKFQELWKRPVARVLAIVLCVMVGSSLVGCHKKTITIAIDAAYGGDNPGYEGIVKEADVTEGIVSALKEILAEDERFQVVYTHESGKSASIDDRVKVLKAQDVELVLSVHADGNPDASISGQEIHVDVPSSSQHKSSLKAAEAVQKAFASDDWNPVLNYVYYEAADNDQFKIVKKDVEDTEETNLETLQLYEKTDLPMIISSSFYVTNQEDVERWANEQGYKKAAEAYYNALLSYFSLSAAK